MFRWLIRGLVFLFLAYGLSNTGLEPNTGFFIAIAVFAMLLGLPGLLGRAHEAYASYRLAHRINTNARRVKSGNMNHTGTCKFRSIP